jgi:CBS domain containing-hemolysin-like protein
VWLSLKISKVIKGNEKDEVYRDEIPALAELGLSSGAIRRSEYRKLKSLLNFAEFKLKDLITPSDKVAGVRYDLTMKESYREVSKNTYSRLVVFGRDHHDIRGYVMRKDILQGLIDEEQLLSHDQNKKPKKVVKDLTRKILILPETTSAEVLFERLLARKAHMAAVINENGDFMGIVTLEDLIEALTGMEIFDEFDQD